MDGHRTVNPMQTCALQAGSIPASGILGWYLGVCGNGNRSVSKTEVPGSSPGTPVNFLVIQRRGGIGNRTGPLNQGAIFVSCGFESHRLCQVIFKLWRVSLIGKAVVSKATVGLYL